MVKEDRWPVRRVTRLGLLAAVGTSLFVLESLIPLPLPFLKIGLANISTVLALIASGPADAVLVVLLRVLAGSLITGSFLGPSFILSLLAGITSAAVMAALQRMTGRLFGPVGLSLAGSTAHVLTQLTVVALLFVRSAAVFRMLPLLLLTGLVGGLVVGLIASRLAPVITSEQRDAARAGKRFRVLTSGDMIAVVLAVAAFAFSFILLPGSTGTTVLIQVDGQTVGRLSLQENRELTVRGYEGDVQVEVRGGRVRVVQADCPNKLCVRTGWRDRAGDMIVCVPNRTVVRIIGNGPGGVSAVTG